jgi:hypothetical protein
MEAPKFTISEETFNNMLTKLSNEVAILEHVVSYAMCIDTDLAWKFRENWGKHPEVLEAFEVMMKNGDYDGN